MAVSTALGTEREIDLGSCRIRYRERGDGPAVVFVHGVIANGDLWRDVVDQLAGQGLRCITPDWPLGAHELAAPGADLTPPGVAALMAEFLAALDLQDVTIVANDTGGALTQILMTTAPERIGRVVLTPSDSYEHFFPPLFRYLSATAKLPGGITVLVQSMRLPGLQRLPIAFGWLAKHGLPADVAASFVRPTRRSRAVRRDLRRFLRTVHRRHTLAAAEHLAEFDKPVLLVWASEDRVFPIADGRRLRDALPNATLVEVADSYTFVPLDQPETLAGHITEFVGTHATP